MTSDFLATDCRSQYVAGVSTLFLIAEYGSALTIKGPRMPSKHDKGRALERNRVQNAATMSPYGLGGVVACGAVLTLLLITGGPDWL